VVSRVTVTVNESLVEEVRVLLGAATKSEAVRRALEEVLRHRKLQRALDNAGGIELDIDPERLRKLREET
jgi:metal-responsive CopG/Arc/MetJ family transcriptional regulator